MLLPIVILIATQLVVPFYFIASVWKSKHTSKFDWILRTAALGSFVVYIFFAGRWDWVSCYLRWVIPVLFVIALVSSVRRLRGLPFFLQESRIRTWGSITVNFLLLICFTTFLAFALRGRMFDEDPIQIAFPLGDGTYYIGQGGNSFIVNFHNTHPTQKYALDIVKLNRAGTRATGIYPKDLGRYAIFGDTLRSPCEGTVITAVDGLPDQSPPATDRRNLAGNHVLLRCNQEPEIAILLAHMQHRSLKVSAGDAISQGQELGRVGNSGNTSEPHLHIHAKRGGREDSGLDGQGVPILFEGRFLIRNSLIDRRE